MRTLSTESRTSRIGRITLDAKQTGERKAANPPIAFDVAGTGNVAWSRCCDTSQPKGRGNREHKLRPKPARQSPTLPVGTGGGQPPPVTRCRVVTSLPTGQEPLRSRGWQHPAKTFRIRANRNRKEGKGLAHESVRARRKG